MNEAALFKLLDVGFTLLQVGLEREAVLARVQKLEQEGATAEQITEALVKMRDEAIDNAQKVIDGQA